MTTEVRPSTWTPQAPAKPPPTSTGVLGWLRRNLFSSVSNSILTVVTLVILYFALTGLARWIAQAYWAPVWENRKIFAVGPFPGDQLGQPLSLLLITSFLFGLSAGRWGSLMRDVGVGLAALLALLAIVPLGVRTQVALAASLALLIGGYVLALRLRFRGRWLVFAWIALLPVTLIVLTGGQRIPLTGITVGFAPIVPSNLWGGLMLTLLLTVVGIAVSFPLGVLLALGRRSPLPVVRWVSTGYIELVRGAPLITLLFMGMVLLPLFLPPTMSAPSALMRVMVAITLFSAAYLAENVRGGLQSIPYGQYEAADALGLHPIDKLRLIILPQALAKVIPAIVGQFISLFKDTSLVALVGLLDLLGVAKSTIQQPAWLGVAGGVTKEVYLFAALVYFIFSFGMSYASKRLEGQLRAGRH
jgi:general L-amino acid transport system permease protein